MSSRAVAGPPTAPAETEAGRGPDVEVALAARADVSAGSGELTAQRDAPVGGQAVLEGVMMRGVSNWAVAVRKPAVEQPGDASSAPGDAAPGDAPGEPGEPALGAIEVRSFPLSSALRRHRVLRLPIVRGVVALAGSLAIG